MRGCAYFIFVHGEGLRTFERTSGILQSHLLGYKFFSAISSVEPLHRLLLWPRCISLCLCGVDPFAVISIAVNASASSRFGPIY